MKTDLLDESSSQVDSQFCSTLFTDFPFAGRDSRRCAADRTCPNAEAGDRGRVAHRCARGRDSISRELVPEEGVDPRTPPRGRRESRPLPRTRLRCASAAMTQQGGDDRRTRSDRQVTEEHVVAGAGAALSTRARASGGGATGWRPRSRGLTQLLVG